MSQKKRPPTRRSTAPKKPTRRRSEKAVQTEEAPPRGAPTEAHDDFAPVAVVEPPPAPAPSELDDFSAGILDGRPVAPPSISMRSHVVPDRIPAPQPRAEAPAPFQDWADERDDTPSGERVMVEDEFDAEVDLEERAPFTDEPIETPTPAERGDSEVTADDRPRRAAGSDERPSRRRGRRGRTRRSGRRDDGVAEERVERPRAARDAPAETIVEVGAENDDDETLFRPTSFEDAVGEDLVEEVEEADERAPAGRRHGAATRESDGPQREMLINVTDSDECRIAVLTDGKLDELYTERAASVSNVGNIYKGKVTNVERSIQAAFIDFGLPVQGFLHISDLHPKYFADSKTETEQVGRKTPRRQRPPIQNCLRRGQEVIVQVIKEGIGTKGPTLSTYISLPGRFLVMMPGMDQLGVSRKIEDEETRRKLRDTLHQLELPKDMGFIVRTAGIDRTKRDLQRDLNYLARLWGQVDARMKKIPAPCELYKESDLVIRTIRDVYDSNLRRVVVDDATVGARVREFLAIASPRSLDVVEHYEAPEPLFHRFGIEHEIDKLHSKHVPLPCGGSLVIEQTEALVAIDVNSGRFRVPDNPEETAYKVNSEAADEIARQLRLRDLGGLIICDFIDMMHETHRRSIERRLADSLKKHKERAKILRISRFGILEMTRQRQRPSFAKNMFRECPRCAGSGRVKAPESVCLDIMRQIRLLSHKEGVASVDVYCSAAAANELLNRKRHHLTDLERAQGQTIRINAEAAFAVDEVRVTSTDRRGREVQASTPAHEPARHHGHHDARPGRPPQGGEHAPQGQAGGPRRRRRRRR